VPNKYTWNVNPKLTGIFIGDKFSAVAGTNEKYPAIILTENTKRWARTSIDQREAFPGLGIDNKTKVRSDLVVGSVTYQCISPNGIEANLVADVLFNALVAYKDDFRKNEIHQLLDIQMGEESLIRLDVIGRAVVVPVTVYYSKQSVIATVAGNYDIRIYTGGFGTAYLQSIIGYDEVADYATYTVSGQYIWFTRPLVSGLTVYARFLDGITLQEKTEELGPGNGIDRLFTLSGAPYMYDTLLHYIEFTTTTEIT
jgi:hypothetical protein